jgi:hypothetical protein
VLRAALTAPAFLTGVSADEGAALRDDAVKASDPERYVKVEALRKGRQCTEKALDAALRAVETAVVEPIASGGTRPAPLPEDPANKRAVLDMLARGPNAERLGLSPPKSDIDP